MCLDTELSSSVQVNSVLKCLGGMKYQIPTPSHKQKIGSKYNTLSAVCGEQSASVHGNKYEFYSCVSWVQVSCRMMYWPLH